MITEEQIQQRQQELEKRGYTLLSERVNAIRVGKTLNEFLNRGNEGEIVILPNDPRAISYRFYIRNLSTYREQQSI